MSSIENLDPGMSRAMESVIAKHRELQKKDRHTFDFSECYDEMELRDEDIYVYYDPLGNSEFAWQPPDQYKVTLGYLLDMVGEPFHFAISWKLDTCGRASHKARYADPKAKFDMSFIDGIYRPTRAHWEIGANGLPVKVHDPVLNWYSTEMSARQFHDELLRRLRETKEIFRRKFGILRWKFDAVRAQMRRSLSVVDCLDANLSEDSLEKSGTAHLANGHILEITRINDDLVTAHDADTATTYFMRCHPAYWEKKVVFTVQGKEQRKLLNSLAIQV